MNDKQTFYHVQNTIQSLSLSTSPRPNSPVKSTSNSDVEPDVNDDNDQDNENKPLLSNQDLNAVSPPSSSSSSSFSSPLLNTNHQSSGSSSKHQKVKSPKKPKNKSHTKRKSISANTENVETNFADVNDNSPSIPTISIDNSKGKIPKFDLSSFKKFLKLNPIRSSFIIFVTFINILLMLICTHYIFYPYLFNRQTHLVFSKIGSVTVNEARISGRFPQDNHVILCYSSSTPINEYSSTLNCTNKYEISKENDYVTTAIIKKLKPITLYYYKWFSLKPNNEKSIISLGNELLDDSKYLTFKTAPLPNDQNQVTFGFSSCVMPSFPYGTSGYKGFTAASKQNLDFFFFLGDLIYSDNPWLYGTSLEAYRWHYRYLYSDMDFLSTFKNLSLSTIYDDHEILNDWRWNEAYPFSVGYKAYNEYAGNSNPHNIRQDSATYNYTYGDIGFFVMDTRRYRNLLLKQMLGNEQLLDLFSWLTNDKSKVKFLVSSVPFTQNWRFGTDDTWGGYLDERQRILDFIYKQQIKNVFILSGDRHEVGVTELPHGVIEFSNSPMQAFYSPVDTYRETGEDKKIFTHRPGNIKWGKITVDVSHNTGSSGKLIYSLYVNDIQDEPIKEIAIALS